MVVDMAVSAVDREDLGVAHLIRRESLLGSHQIVSGPRTQTFISSKNRTLNSNK